MKKVLALLLAAIMVLALSACGGNPADDPTPSSADTTSPTATATDDGPEVTDAPIGNTGVPSGVVSAKDTLRIAVTGDTGNLNATKGTFAGVSYQFREPLFTTDYEGNTVWLLATGKEDISDTEWKISLRQGVTFSNGSPFTAEDVMFTLQNMFNTGNSMFIRDIDIEKCEIVDDYTIIIRLKTPNMQQWGSLVQVLIVDKETYDEAASVTRPIGTGAYIVTDYVMNSHIYMKANENYWGGKPPIENLEFVIMTEDAQFLNAMQTGTVDICIVPGQDVEFARTLTDFNMTQYYLNYTSDIQFNVTEHSIFNNLDARLAVCYATDRQAMLDLAYFGNGSLLHFPVSEHMYDYYDELADLHDVYKTGYNLEKAKEYAEKSGLVGQTVKIITNGSPAFVTQAEILQANLKDIGVTAIIENYDAASYFSIYMDPTAFDINIWAHSSPQNYAAGLLAENVMWCEAVYNGWDKYYEYCEFAAKVLATMNEEDRVEMLYDLTVMFEEGCLWYGICDTTANLATRVGLEGVTIFNSGTLLYKTMYWSE